MPETFLVKKKDCMAIDSLDRSVTEALRAWRVQHSAGLDVVQSLTSCATLCSDTAAGACFRRAALRATEGDGIPGLLGELRPMLSEAERAVIAAGWHSGRVEAVLDSVVVQRELWAQARSTIRSRLILPLIMLLMASLLAPLPALIAGTGSFTDYIINALTPLGIAFIVWRVIDGALAARTPGLDSFMLTAPLISRVEKQRCLSEFASTLSLLVGAGTSVSSALEICARAASNSLYRAELLRCEKIVAQGNPISSAMRPGNLWPHECISMIQIGEKSGTLDDALARMGKHYREEYSRAIEAFAAWLPRFMYALVALFVMFQIAKLVFTLSGFYK